MKVARTVRSWPWGLEGGGDGGGDGDGSDECNTKESNSEYIIIVMVMIMVMIMGRWAMDVTRWRRRACPPKQGA